MNRRRFFQTAGKLAGAGLMAPLLSGRPKVRAGRSPGPVKVGQMGTAHAHAAGKMATLRKLSECYQVVGIAEHDPERRSKLKNHSAYRGLKWISEEQLLNTPGLQAVTVETDIPELVPTAMRCVSAGMHVHLDKPAGLSLSEFRKLLNEATRRKLTVQMGYMFRHNPAFKFCFRAAQRGWLGDIFEVHGVISKTIGAEQRRRLAVYPGSMFELGCHLIDAMVKVLGRPDKVTGFSRRTRPDRDDLARIIRGEKESKYPPEHDLAVQETILKASGVALD